MLNLWEIPEVTTVAKAVDLTHRFRRRRNLRKLPQVTARSARTD